MKQEWIPVCLLKIYGRPIVKRQSIVGNCGQMDLNANVKSTQKESGSESVLSDFLLDLLWGKKLFI